MNWGRSIKARKDDIEKELGGGHNKPALFVLIVLIFIFLIAGLFISTKKFTVSSLRVLDLPQYIHNKMDQRFIRTILEKEYPFEISQIGKFEFVDIEQDNSSDDFLVNYKSDDTEETYWDAFVRLGNEYVNVLHKSYDTLGTEGNLELIRNDNEIYLVSAIRQGNGGFLDFEFFRYSSFGFCQSIFKTDTQCDEQGTVTFPMGSYRIKNNQVYIACNRGFFKIGFKDKSPFLEKIPEAEITHLSSCQHELIIYSSANVVFDQKKIATNREEGEDCNGNWDCRCPYIKVSMSLDERLHILNQTPGRVLTAEGFDFVGGMMTIIKPIERGDHVVMFDPSGNEEALWIRISVE